MIWAVFMAKIEQILGVRSWQLCPCDANSLEPQKPHKSQADRQAWLRPVIPALERKRQMIPGVSQTGLVSVRELWL